MRGEKLTSGNKKKEAVFLAIENQPLSQLSRLYLVYIKSQSKRDISHLNIWVFKKWIKVVFHI